jgi:hypothetical protein
VIDMVVHHYSWHRSFCICIHPDPDVLHQLTYICSIVYRQEYDFDFMVLTLHTSVLSQAPVQTIIIKYLSQS